MEMSVARADILQVPCSAVIVCLLDSRPQVGQPELRPELQPELRPELQPELQPHSMEAWLDWGFESLFASLSFLG